MNILRFSKIPNPESWDDDSFACLNEAEAKKGKALIEKAVKEARREGYLAGLEAGAKAADDCACSHIEDDCPGCCGDSLASAIRSLGWGVV